MSRVVGQALDLSTPSEVADGLRHLQLPLQRCDLAAEVRRLLVAKGIVHKPVPLEDLHLHLSADMQRPDENGLNAVTRAFYETDSAFTDKYLEVIRHLAREVFTFDFLFQATPTMRFHFPVRFVESFRDESGHYLGHHNDGMLGHSVYEVNCWMPLTDCIRSAALQIASLADSIHLLRDFSAAFGHDADVFHSQGRTLFVDRLFKDRVFREETLRATRAVDMKYGDILVFDSRCIHATAENEERKTRISLDFRLIPLARYQALGRLHASRGRSKRKFVRGDVFSQLSSAQLLSSMAAH